MLYETHEKHCTLITTAAQVKWRCIQKLRWFFDRSIYGIRYEKYIGDWDNKTLKAIHDLEPYYNNLEYKRRICGTRTENNGLQKVKKNTRDYAGVVPRADCGFDAVLWDWQTEDSNVWTIQPVYFFFYSSKSKQIFVGYIYVLAQFSILKIFHNGAKPKIYTKRHTFISSVRDFVIFFWVFLLSDRCIPFFKMTTSQIYPFYISGLKFEVTLEHPQICRVYSQATILEVILFRHTRKRLCS